MCFLKNIYFSIDRPFSPRNFTQLNSPDATSIKISWLEIPQNETGEDFDGYKVRFYMRGMPERTNLTTTPLSARPNRQPNYERVTKDDQTFLEYAITGLNPQKQYHVWVLGYNKWGEGDSTPRELFQPGVDRECVDS